MLFSLHAAAQTVSHTTAEDTKWLEQRLNVLVNAKDTDAQKKQFTFNQCQCTYAARNNDKGGLNFDMNYSFDLKEINSVSYARNEDNTYELIVKLNTEKNPLNFGSITTTLYTSDEKKVKEVVSKFRSSVKTCNSSN